MLKIKDFDVTLQYVNNFSQRFELMKEVRRNHSLTTKWALVVTPSKSTAQSFLFSTKRMIAKIESTALID